MTPEPDRRSFVAFAIFGIGAIFSALLGFPIVCYFIDPRNRRGAQGAFKLAEGVNVDDLAVDTPQQGVLRDTRVDGWTLYPSDVLGRVWVVLKQAIPANFRTPEGAKEFNEKTQAERDRFLQVFTTICPHLGCSINLGGPAFSCPCHAATFNANGSRAAASNPAKRDMDTLEWKLDEQDPSRIVVVYRRFKALEEEKLPVG